MTVVIEGEKSFFLGSQAVLLDEKAPREMAWAERSIAANPAYRWILGRYVEADRANSNKQYWALDQLLLSQPTIANSPLNMLHRARHVVGHFVDTELMHPLDETANNDGARPYIEALACFYRYYFPDELALVEAAHATGSLYYSMECVSESITCGGEEGCSEEYAYMGPRDESYCNHLNEGLSIKQLNKPHFLAGALIIPPERPGWKGAEIRDLSALVKEHQVEAENAYEQVRSELPDASVEQWEYLMGKILAMASAT